MMGMMGFKPVTISNSDPGNGKVVDAGTSQSLGKAVLSLPDLCTGGIWWEFWGCCTGVPWCPIKKALKTIINGMKSKLASSDTQ